MKFKLSYIGIALLVVVASIYFFSNSKGTLNRHESNFVVDVIEDISEIQISEEEHSVILTKQKNTWKVNNKYQVKEWNINNFLVAINRLEIIAPVSNSENEQIKMLLENDGISVEFFNGNRSIKKYYVSKPSMNKSKTYMLMNRSDQAFAVRIPSFKGLVADLFVAEENYWRDKTVFNYLPQNIKNITTQYPENNEKSYKLINYNDGSFALQKLPSNEFVEDFKVDKAARFFTYFQNIHFDDVVSELSAVETDSIINTEPFAIIKVEDVDGLENSIKMYRKPAPNKLDEFGQNAEFDYNKAYGVLNNANEIILLQYYKFDPILKEIDYFR